MINSLPIRYNYNKCDAHTALAFIDALKNDKRIILKTALPSTDKCHFERYNFLMEKNKIVVVYDIKANIFSVTAKPPVLEFVKAQLSKAVLTITNNEVTSTVKPQQNDIPPLLKPSTVAVIKPIEQPTQVLKPSTVAVIKPIEQPIQVLKPSTIEVIKPSDQSNSVIKQSAPQVKKTTAVSKKESAKPKAKKAPAEEIKKVIPKEDKIEPSEPLPEYKNGFSIKKCPLEALEGIIKRVKALDGITVKAEQSTFVGTPQETKTYELTDKNKQKLYLRYMLKKQSLQLQGKRSNIFGEVQVILSRDSGYLEAVGSHIELTGEDKRAGEIQRDLKKLLPDAFPYLSEQSKIDLSIGMIDIGNEDVKLSDYSVLLVPPYRGLERFIYDLQVAQGITVKMIGQAYEKNDAGQYLLKLGYRKKIAGVVYSEVMSALYTEYFAKRNFYAHSDNSLDSQVRRIDDKSVAKTIFNNLCEIINYNSRKLKEIGFAII